MRDYERESLSYCPIHGYIPFISKADRPDRESTERELIDHPWIQRLRQIHQLQTAWWVFPTAEHTRFQHVIGAMHVASLAIERLYPSLHEVCPDVPSRGYVECLLRMAALLHDVGHGPLGHFFDEHCLQGFGLTHETLGSAIIQHELGDLIRGIRAAPNSRMEEGESLDPADIAFLITRPKNAEQIDRPRWLQLLRPLFSGIYTVDNMDFVLRDAFMTGYNARAFDLPRLLRYSFYSDDGLTIHPRGMNALLSFMRVRSELFQSVYFHRTVKAIDLTLADLFPPSRSYLLPTNPLDDMEAYRGLTEFSLWVDVNRWPKSDDPIQRELGLRWQRVLARKMEWKMIWEHRQQFHASNAESSSIFSDAETLLARIRRQLPVEFAQADLRIDLPRHIQRPQTKGQNFLYDDARRMTRPLMDDELFRKLPLAGRICRVYARPDSSPELARAVATAAESLVGGPSVDDLTNM